jgi:hypothetical protein
MQAGAGEKAVSKPKAKKAASEKKVAVPKKKVGIVRDCFQGLSMCMATGSSLHGWKIFCLAYTWVSNLALCLHDMHNGVGQKESRSCLRRVMEAMIS